MAHAPQNTMEAFELALRLGATGLETDIWLTTDGVAVCDHDGVIRGKLRKRAICDLRYDELPTTIPKAVDLFTLAAAAGVPVSVDVCDAAGLGVIVGDAHAAGLAQESLWLCHTDIEMLTAWRAISPQVRLVNSTRLAAMREGPERRAAVLAERGIDAVNLHHLDWSGGLTSLFHRFERYCLGWDLQHPRTIATGLRIGLDGLFGDWVDRLVDPGYSQPR